MIEAGWDMRTRITSDAMERQEEPIGAAGKSTQTGRDKMNPVIGLDISKEESHGQAFLERGKPYRGTFHFEHTREGLAKLLSPTFVK